MNARGIIRIVLLGVVAAGVGIWAVKEFGPAATAGTGNPVAPAARPDGVTVIHFHGDKRCRTCIGIGELAKKTINDVFASEVSAGKVRWEMINFDEPANAHFTNDYGLVGSVVVVTLWKDGKEVKWKRLDGVWDHYGDEEKFRAYLADNVRGLLNQP